MFGSRPSGDSRPCGEESALWGRRAPAPGSVLVPVWVTAMRVAMVSLVATRAADPASKRRTRAVCSLAEALARAGHQVVVYTEAPEQEPWPRFADDAGFQLTRLSVGSRTAAAEEGTAEGVAGLADELRNALRLQPPDVIHSQSCLSGMVVERAVPSSGSASGPPSAPTVQSFDDGLRLLGPGGAGPESADTDTRTQAERALARRAGHVIAASNDELAGLVRLGVPRRRLTVVPPGVDPNEFCPDGPREARGAKRRVVVVSPGNGAQDAIRALTVLPDTEFVMLFDSPPERRLEELAGRLRVGERIRLTDQVDDARLPALLRSADLVLSLPGSGRTPATPVQAMACGVPVVASAGGSAGGSADAVVHGITGLHVPTGKPRALAKVLRALLANAAMREAMGIAGRDRAVTRYRWSRIASESSRVYERVVLNSRAGV